MSGYVVSTILGIIAALAGVAWWQRRRRPPADVIELHREQSVTDRKRIDGQLEVQRKQSRERREAELRALAHEPVDSVDPNTALDILSGRQGLDAGPSTNTDEERGGS